MKEHNFYETVPSQTGHSSAFLLARAAHPGAPCGESACRERLPILFSRHTEASSSMFLRHSVCCVASCEGSPCRRCFPPGRGTRGHAGVLFCEQSCALPIALCCCTLHISHCKRRHNKFVLKQTSV